MANTSRQRYESRCIDQIVLLSMLADTVADQAQAWTNTNTNCGQLVDTIPQGTGTTELLELMSAIIAQLQESWE